LLFRKTTWTNARLQKLFERYNRKFWSGKLHNIVVRDARLEGSQGEWDPAKREIALDALKHGSDREIRSNVLHEMCHAAAHPERTGHSYKFYTQLEHILGQKAPVTIGSPETPGLKILAGAVPRRFPLARAMMEKAEKRREAELERWTKAHPDGATEIVTRQEILRDFADAAAEGLNWRKSLWAVGAERGLIDVGGKPKSKWSERVIAEARKAHRRARRDFVERARISAKFEAARATPSETAESERPAGENCRG
jgi:SprT-like family protein